MVLNKKNYHDKETNMEYMSVSQYKAFCGSLGQKGCEAKAMAELAGEWIEAPSTALLVGSYVDAYFSGEIEVFKSENPDIFTKQGELKSTFKQANVIIERIERDPYFMKYLSGDKQVIMTSEVFGIPWKIKIDSLIKDTAIVDLKIMADLRKTHYAKDYGPMSFVEYWGYDFQGAIYQEVVYKNTGKRLPFYIAGASKESEPDIEIIHIDDKTLSEALSFMSVNIDTAIDIKAGNKNPEKCGVCDYCRHHRVLTAPIHYSELTGVKI